MDKLPDPGMCHRVELEHALRPGDVESVTLETCDSCVTGMHSHNGDWRDAVNVTGWDRNGRIPECLLPIEEYAA